MRKVHEIRTINGYLIRLHLHTRSTCECSISEIRDKFSDPGSNRLAKIQDRAYLEAVRNHAGQPREAR